MADKNFEVRRGLNVANGLFNVNSASGRISVNTGSPLVTFEVGGSDAVKIAVGNTAQRPAGNDGYIRYNSETGLYEGYANGAWGPLKGADTAVGGSNTQILFNDSGTINGSSYFTFDTTTKNINVGNNLSIVNSVYIGNTGNYVIMNGSNVAGILGWNTWRMGNTSINSTINSTAVSARAYTGNGVMQAANTYFDDSASVVVMTDKLNDAGVFQTFTDSSSPSWSMKDGIHFKWILGAARQLPNPTEFIEGRSGVFWIKPAGNYALTFGNCYVFDSNSAPAISNSTNVSTFLSYFSLPGDKILITIPAKGVTGV